VLTAIIGAPLVGLVVMMITSSRCTYRCGEQDPPPGTRAGTDGTLRILGLSLRGLGGATTAGTLLEVWTCHGQPVQQRRFVDGRIVNPGTGLCVDTEGGRSGNGTRLAVVACNDEATQRWTPPPLAE
jgi:hypothetical protein